MWPGTSVLKEVTGLKDGKGIGMSRCAVSSLQKLGIVACLVPIGQGKLRGYMSWAARYEVIWWVVKLRR